MLCRCVHVAVLEYCHQSCNKETGRRIAEQEDARKEKKGQRRRKHVTRTAMAHESRPMRGRRLHGKRKNVGVFAGARRGWHCSSGSCSRRQKTPVTETWLRGTASAERATRHRELPERPPPFPSEKAPVKIWLQGTSSAALGEGHLESSELRRHVN